MKEKPPVLSDELLEKAYYFWQSYNQWELELSLREVAQAQRDADMDWFKKQGHEAISYLEGYQKGKQETAREIFEEIETCAELLASRIGDTPISLVIASSDWQSLKSKYLGGSQLERWN